MIYFKELEMSGPVPLTHSDTEFLSEDEEVEIIPRFRLDRLQFLNVRIC